MMLIGLTFAALNSTPVWFNYYLGTTSIALSLLLVMVFGVGILVGLISSFLPWLGVKCENSRLKARLKIVEREVENLRSIPIKGE